MIEHGQPGVDVRATLRRASATRDACLRLGCRAATHGSTRSIARRARAAARRSARSRGRSGTRRRSWSCPRAERRDQHRHAGADVGARHALPVELRRAVDDRAVRVAEDDPRAHRDELVDEEEPVLEHLLEDQDRPLRLRRDASAIDVRSAGNAGQGPSSIFGIWPPRSSWTIELLARRHAQRGRRRARPHAGRSNAAGSESRSSGSTSSIVRSPPVTAARPMKLADLDVLGTDRGTRRRAERSTPGCAARSSRSRRSSRPERDEEAAEILDVRLAGGVPIIVSPGVSTRP